MADKSKRLSQVSDIATNLYAGLVFAMISAIAAALYSRYGAAWTLPLVNGLVAGTVALGLFLSWKALTLLPDKKERVTLDNVGLKVLEWLHKFNLEVKKINLDDTHFAYKVTTDGGKIVQISRSVKTFPDYLTVRAFVTVTEEDKLTLLPLNEEDKIRLRTQIHIELSRSVVGFKTDDWLTQGGVVFKHIPITSQLSEETVIDAIWTLEATVATIFSTGLLAVLPYRSEMLSKAQKGIVHEA